MRVKIFKTQKAAMTFAHHFLINGRIVGVRRLRSGNWEARILARRPK